MLNMIVMMCRSDQIFYAHELTTSFGCPFFQALKRLPEDSEVFAETSA